MLNTACALALTVALQSGAIAPASPAQAPPAQASAQQTAAAKTPAEQAPAAQAPAAQAAVPRTAADPWPDERPVTHLFQNLWHDFIALPSVNTAIVLTAGGVAAPALHPADDNVSNWAEEAGTTPLTTVGNAIGSGWTQVGGAVATYAVGKIVKHPQTIHLGGDLIRAQAMNAVMTGVIKVAVDRTRPTGGSHSFPSGHTSASFASATVLQAHYGWKVGIPAYAVAGFAGWARVRDRAHWLSDVGFGAAVGIVSGLTVTTDHRKRTWSVMPTADPQSLGIAFVKNLKNP